jgi:hypothetical protein
MARRLGVGFIGSGFITRFHIRNRSWPCGTPCPRHLEPERDARAAETAAYARCSLRDRRYARPTTSIDRHGGRPGDRCVLAVRAKPPPAWRTCRGDRLRTGVRPGQPCAASRARSLSPGMLPKPGACVELDQTDAGVLHGYLEDQLFVPSHRARPRARAWARGAALSGRPYLARSAEEHGGPHMPWFWQGDLQGGGVLNDMMCHSRRGRRDIC